MQQSIKPFLRYIPIFVFLTILGNSLQAQNFREKLLMDSGWRFAYGHPYDTEKDFNYGTSGFSFYAKAGFGDGPASVSFDDNTWRKLDLPHDWAVEAPFDSKGSGSHGYKAIGRNFPERSVGWYRKTFNVSKAEEGKRFVIEFDGVFRNSIVFINGHYLGVEPSGYSSFNYDITDYLNYDGSNVIAVRVDATMEEGWFYEGAGIYRHVWLTKTAPIHVAHNGTFVTSEVKDKSSSITIKTTLVNDGKQEGTVDLDQIIVNAKGTVIDSFKLKKLRLAKGQSIEYPAQITLSNPNLWSLENPYLYKLITRISIGGKITDQYETAFGIRSIRFDPNEGFFLNGKHVVLKGTNNHQDHAGVGAAIPDELQRFRIMKLKEMGCNAFRCSHNPPTPEMLNACDELGMLVIDENRLMGTSDQVLHELKRMIVRDRNHPSVILYSIGNEEWGMEGSETGTRIAATMRDYARKIDSTRLYTAAVSGGWGGGISLSLDVMGYNYMSHGNTDDHHKTFPNQSSVATEEAASFATRGIYVEDKANCHSVAYDFDPTDWGASAEEAWSYYAKRPYVAGMFIWSGFDYRGEPTPFGWPAICSQFGVLDLCGFPKDNAYYYKSWWTTTPMVHLFPHWNWQEKEGQNIKVWCYSNCDEVELILNKVSLGKKKVEKNAHAEWSVPYAKGELIAKGYVGGKELVSDKVETTDEPATISLQPHKPAINADREDVSVITITVSDAKKRSIPNASNEISFTLEGPGKIIGVGNGDPSSLEADKYIETVTSIMIKDWKVKVVDGKKNRAEISYDYADTNWDRGFNLQDDNNSKYIAKVFRGKFELSDKLIKSPITLFIQSIGANQSIYINGKLLQENLAQVSTGHEIKLDPSLLRSGNNVIAIVATPIEGRRKGGESPGALQIVKPSGQWKRKLFSGKAQIIVQSTSQAGEITLKATTKDGLKGELKILSIPAKVRTSVE